MLKVYTNKKVWAQECARMGAVNHLSEINTYVDLGPQHMQVYAVCTGNKGLCGVWHPLKQTGVVYLNPMNQFATKLRTFVSEKLSKYT